MVWLIMKFSRPSGLSLLRLFSAAFEFGYVKSIYVKQVAHRTNIYAIETDNDSRLLESLRLRDAKFEVLAKAEKIELVGWTPIEIVKKKYRNKVFDFLETEFKFIKVGDKTVPLGRFNEMEWEEVAEQ